MTSQVIYDLYVVGHVEKLTGKDLSCYLNTVESVGLRKA